MGIFAPPPRYFIWGELMSAAIQRSISDRGVILQFPSIFRPVEAPTGPTTSSSGSGHKKRHKSKQGQRELPFELCDTPGRYQAELLARQFADDVLTPEAAARIAETTTVAGYYRQVMLPTIRGSRAPKTLEHYVTALSEWEKYAPKIDHPEWAGMPIKLVTARYIEAYFEAAEAELAPSTIALSWKKLRAILRHAKDRKVIEKVPTPKPVSVDEGSIVTYTDDQIEQAYRALNGNLELQVAFVLSINTGMRPVDLFCLRVSDLELATDPAVTFRARKTDKQQSIPLAPITVAQLLRLPREGDYLFPSLSNPIAQAPESSAAAVRRNEEFKLLLSAVGIKHERPWKVCRATCNTRLENVKSGVGEFVLGHSLKGVNAKHYYDRTAVVTDTVNAVKQPDCFSL